MQGALRSCGGLAKGLACWAPPRWSVRVATFNGVLLQPFCAPSRDSAIRLSHSGQSKDYSLPNASWSPAMMEQFHKYTELSKDETWRRVPSARHFIEQIPGKTREEIEEAKKKGTRFFLRNLDIEGAGFEYVAFFNLLEKKLVTIMQLGPYLEGNPGFVHGGAIAAILDSMLAGCAIFTAGYGMMANLNINYRSPITLGSVILTLCKVDREEGRKMFVSGRVQNADGQTLHAEATALLGTRILDCRDPRWWHPYSWLSRVLPPWIMESQEEEDAVTAVCSSRRTQRSPPSQKDVPSYPPRAHLGGPDPSPGISPHEHSQSNSKSGPYI